MVEPLKFFGDTGMGAVLNKIAADFVVLVAEYLSARYLILQHTLPVYVCIFVRHAYVRMRRSRGQASRHARV